ncbi:hypothetical protein FQJ65_01185 [Escherichia coli]|nr:hypothetical protein [Escherichia coli]
MAISDMINNNSFNGQYLLGDQQYNPTQSDVLGRLRSPTPTNAGLPNIDPQNDDRNSFDLKQQQKQANIDTLEAHDSPDAIKGKDGFIYNTVPDTRKDQLITGLIAYGTSFLAGENTGQSLQRAGEAVNSHIATIKRQNLIPQLEAKGYQSVDIQRYIETGNTTDLLTNKGKYVPVDGGYINNLTSDFVQTQQTNVNQLKPGETIGVNITPEGKAVTIAQDGKGNYTRNASTKSEIEASQLAATATGGEDGSESLNAQAAGHIGFRVGTNNKPIESGQYDQNGNPLYFGADNKSLVDASGNGYYGPTSNEISQKQQQADQKTSEAATGQLALIDQSIKTATDFKNSPGRNSLYSWSGLTPNLSDDARDAEALRKQMSGQAFLQARQYLKGQGAITDFESQKAESALALILDTSISDEKANQAINDYLEVLNTGKARLQKMQQKGQPAQAQAPTATTPATPTGVKDHSNLW